MSEQNNNSTEQYFVSCHSCKQSFDALAAQWCDCLVNEPTLVCTGCQRCFCKAPPAYKSSFWSDAPSALWARKHTQRREQFTAPANPPPDQVTRPLILVVEDEKEIQRVAYRVIESLGYAMILARNGEEGLELAHQYRPDLILTDALMPKMDGREMAKKLKSEPDTANIKIVVMTSLYTNVKHKIEAYKKFDVDDYLNKPLDFEQLRAVLAKHLKT